MSKIADELLTDIKSNPDSWRNYKGYGIQKDSIIICGYGNSALLSIIDIEINGNDIPALEYMDKYRLEKAITNWYRIVGLKTLSK